MFLCRLLLRRTLVLIVLLLLITRRKSDGDFVAGNQEVERRSTTTRSLDHHHDNDDDDDVRLRGAGHSIRRRRRPNVLLLITDDQDVLLGSSSEYMPTVDRVLRKRGVSFDSAYVHTPICCPSRSSILTGKYLHNGGMAINNSVSGNCNGPSWQKESEPYTFAVAAQQRQQRGGGEGYHTAYAGKYLNQYGAPGTMSNHVVPPGWDRWMGLVGNSIYYQYDVIKSDDGGKTAERERHEGDYHKDYLPDLVANRTLRVIRDWYDTNNKNNKNNKNKAQTSDGTNADDNNEDDTDDRQPFLIVAAWPTPHAPYTPAPQYASAFDDGTKAPRTENWNATNNRDKHWIMRRLAAIDDETERWIDDKYRMRLESLLSVDDHVGQFVRLLEDIGELDDTYIIYTSDNGFQLGQFRLMWDKRQLYENDIRVPLIVRGPPDKTRRNVVIAKNKPVLNIDIAPTIHHIITGEREPPARMDGRSFLPLVTEKSNNNDNDDLEGEDDDDDEWPSDFLISYHGEGGPCGMWVCPPIPPEKYHGGDSKNNTFHCVRQLPMPPPGKTGTKAKNTKEMVEKDFIYCRFEDDENFVEYYDLRKDPWQLNNAANELSPLERQRLERRLQYLRQCRGPSCRGRYQETTTTTASLLEPSTTTTSTGGDVASAR